MEFYTVRIRLSIVLVACVAAAPAMPPTQAPPTPTPSPTPAQTLVLPQLSAEYFQPFDYDPSIDSPLRGVRIDLTFVARSIVTVYNLIASGGYMTWIAAFAVIFLIILAFINMIIRRTNYDI